MGKGICTMLCGVKYKCTARLKFCKILMLILPRMSCMLSQFILVFYDHMQCVCMFVYISHSHTPMIRERVSEVNHVSLSSSLPLGMQSFCFLFIWWFWHKLVYQKEISTFFSRQGLITFGLWPCLYQIITLKVFQSYQQNVGYVLHTSQFLQLRLLAWLRHP